MHKKSSAMIHKELGSGEYICAGMMVTVHSGSDGKEIKAEIIRRGQINMKVFTPSFTEEPNANPYPSKAHNWNSIADLRSAYEEFVQTCDNFGSVPAPVWIFIGCCQGDEEQYGYPDYPDYIMRVNKSGSVVKEIA